MLKVEQISKEHIPAKSGILGYVVGRCESQGFKITEGYYRKVIQTLGGDDALIRMDEHDDSRCHGLNMAKIYAYNFYHNVDALRVGEFLHTRCVKDVYVYLAPYPSPYLPIYDVPDRRDTDEQLMSTSMM